MIRPMRAGQFSLSAQDRWWYARAAEEIRAAPGRWLRLLGDKDGAVPERGGVEQQQGARALHRGLLPGPALPVVVRRPGLPRACRVGDPSRAAARSASRPSSRDSAFRSSSSSSASATVCPSCRCSRLPRPPAPGSCSTRSARGAGGAQPGWPRSAPRPAVGVFPDWFGAGRERINADFQMGQVFLMRNEPARALASLEQARAADPQNPDVLNSLGAARVGSGDLDGAETAYRQALELGDFGGDLVQPRRRRGAARRRSRARPRRSATAGPSRSTPPTGDPAPISPRSRPLKPASGAPASPAADDGAARRSGSSLALLCALCWAVVDALCKRALREHPARAVLGARWWYALPPLLATLAVAPAPAAWTRNSGSSSRCRRRWRSRRCSSTCGPSRWRRSR